MDNTKCELRLRQAVLECVVHRGRNVQEANKIISALEKEWITDTNTFCDMTPAMCNVVGIPLGLHSQVKAYLINTSLPPGLIGSSRSDWSVKGANNHGSKKWDNPIVTSNRNCIKSHKTRSSKKKFMNTSVEPKFQTCWVCAKPLDKCDCMSKNEQFSSNNNPIQDTSISDWLN